MIAVDGMKVAAAAEGSSLSLMDVFKKAGDTWDCPDCMVTNKTSMLSCPCCSASQPGVKTSAAATATGAMFKVCLSKHTEMNILCNGLLLEALSSIFEIKEG